jgi:hypothetical protein
MGFSGSLKKIKFFTLSQSGLEFIQIVYIAGVPAICTSMRYICLENGFPISRAPP